MTLLVLFYTEENWRGKRAWESCRRELEAKGEVLDWAAYLPAPVPDEQNVFKAPMMAEWFVAPLGGLGDWEARNGGAKYPAFGHTTNDQQSIMRSLSSVLLAEVEVLPPDAPKPSEHADAILRLSDPATPALLLSRVSRNFVMGATGCVLAGVPPNQAKPEHVVLLAEGSPSAGELTQKLLAAPFGDEVQLVSSGPGAFRLWLKPAGRACVAADYLAWSNPLHPEFDTIRKALERPLARMDADYAFERPSIDFIRMRTVTQILSQRAQCYLLLGQPEAALHELTLVHELCRLLDAKPITVVAAMINVAIRGMYVGVVEEGIQHRAWGESQLAALEQQLQQINLLPSLVDAFQAERAASSRMLETGQPSKSARLRHFPRSRMVVVQREDRFWALLPDGWEYQNRAVLARALERVLSGIDAIHGVVRPALLDAVAAEFPPNSRYFRPYGWLAGIAVPNSIKATSVTVFKQTLVNQALLACALERYRLAHQEYPASLDALVPLFVASVPDDLFARQPLSYRRTGPNSFVLYSVGWDEKDDGGVPAKTGEKRGDWVWQ